MTKHHVLQVSGRESYRDGPGAAVAAAQAGSRITIELVPLSATMAATRDPDYRACSGRSCELKGGGNGKSLATLLAEVSPTPLFMSLKTTAAAGIRWAAASAALGSALRLLQRVVLARLLLPEEMGLASMVIVVIGLAEFLADFGVSSAIIQRPSNTRGELSSLYWLNLAGGLGTAALILGLNGPIASLFSEPRLLPLLPWAAVAFLLSPLGQQFQALSVKELAFRRLAFIEVSSGIIQVLASVVTVVNGAGVFALIWGHLAGIFAKTVLLVASGWNHWRPGLHFRWSELDGYWQFGLFQVGRAIMGYASVNIDYVIVGRYLGAETLGVYWLAYQLVVWPVTRIVPVITRVSFPAFSRIQHDEESLRRAFVEVSRATAYIVFPALAGIAVTAPILVPTVFGSGWDEAVGLARILVPLSLVRALGQPLLALLLAKGRADFSFWTATLAALCCTVVFLGVVQNGVEAIAWSYAGLSGLFLALRTYTVKHILGLRARDYLAALVPPTMLSATMAGMVFALDRFVYSALPANAGRLLLLAISGVLTYLVLCLLLQRQYVERLWGLLSRRATSEPAAHTANENPR